MVGGDEANILWMRPPVYSHLGLWGDAVELYLLGRLVDKKTG